jgi:hypothetical protein
MSRSCARAFETGKEHLTSFEIWKKRFLMNNSLLKSGQHGTTTFESQSGAISPVLKSFRHIQKVLVLNS